MTDESAKVNKSSGRRAASGAAVVLLAAALSAATALCQAPAPNASDVQIHLERAEAALRANAPATAAEQFRQVLALDPKNAEAYANLGVIAFFERDYPQAAKDLSSALAIDPSQVKTRALLGICEAKLGSNAAQADLDQSFSKLQDRRLRTETGMALANLYYRQGDLGRAASVAHALVDINPDDVNVLFMAQRIYNDLAYETTNKLAVLAPGSAQMQELIAERLVNAGNLPGAVDHYRKALAIDPRLAGVRFELGEAILQSAPANAQDQAAAKQEFEAAQKTEGDTAAIECALGEVAFRQSNLADAYAHYRRAFSMDSSNAEANLGMGKVLMTMGKPNEAVQYLRAAIRVDPLNADAHYRLAEACRKLKMTDESGKEFRLFQEIKQTQDRVRALYREMNGRTDSGGMSSAAKPE